LSYRNL